MSLDSVMVTVKRIAGIVLQWATAYAALIVLAATNLSVRKVTSSMRAWSISLSDELRQLVQTEPSRRSVRIRYRSGWKFEGQDLGMGVVAV